MSSHALHRNHYGLLRVQSCERTAPLLCKPLAFFIFTTVLLATIIQSGCVGLTSAKGNSASATNSQTVPSGTLAASPTALSFGNVTVGSTSNQSLTMTNSGTA